MIDDKLRTAIDYLLETGKVKIREIPLDFRKENLPYEIEEAQGTLRYAFYTDIFNLSSLAVERATLVHQLLRFKQFHQNSISMDSDFWHSLSENVDFIKLLTFDFLAIYFSYVRDYVDKQGAIFDYEPYPSRYERIQLPQLSKKVEKLNRHREYLSKQEGIFRDRLSKGLPPYGADQDMLGVKKLNDAFVATLYELAMNCLDCVDLEERLIRSSLANIHYNDPEGNIPSEPFLGVSFRRAAYQGLTRIEQHESNNDVITRSILSLDPKNELKLLLF